MENYGACDAPANFGTTTRKPSFNQFHKSTLLCRIVYSEQTILNSLIDVMGQKLDNAIFCPFLLIIWEKIDSKIMQK